MWLDNKDKSIEENKYSIQTKNNFQLEQKIKYICNHQIQDENS